MEFTITSEDIRDKNTGIFNQFFTQYNMRMYTHPWELIVLPKIEDGRLDGYARIMVHPMHNGLFQAYYSESKGRFLLVYDETSWVTVADFPISEFEINRFKRLFA